jgi:hypothetical protein
VAGGRVGWEGVWEALREAGDERGTEAGAAVGAGAQALKSRTGSMARQMVFFIWHLLSFILLRGGTNDVGSWFTQDSQSFPLEIASPGAINFQYKSI